MSDLSPDLESIIDESRTAHDPDHGECERIAALLASRLAIAPTVELGPGHQVDSSATIAPGTGVSGSVGLGGMSLKLVWVAVMATVGTGLFVWGREAPRPSNVARTSTASEVAREAQEPAVPAAQEHAPPAPLLEQVDRQRSQQRVPSEAEPVMHDAPATEGAVRGRSERPRRRQDVPPMLGTRSSASTRARHSSNTASTELARPSEPSSDQAARASEERSAPTPALPTAPGELALMRSILTALRDREYAQALQQIEQHEARFRHGNLEHEREGLRVVALCALGRNDAGRREQAAFLREDSQSPLADRVRAACRD